MIKERKRTQHQIHLVLTQCDSDEPYNKMDIFLNVAINISDALRLHAIRMVRTEQTRMYVFETDSYFAIQERIYLLKNIVRFYVETLLFH